jgi:hypothetical protein
MPGTTAGPLLPAQDHCSVLAVTSVVALLLLLLLLHTSTAS